MTPEEKAKAYADQINDSTTEVWHFSDEVHEMLSQAYLAGAAEALRSQWKDAGKELPEMRQRVLVCYKENDCKRPLINISKRIPYASDNPDNPKWEWNNILRHEDVIGWVPLPPLPNTQEQSPNEHLKPQEEMNKETQNLLWAILSKEDREQSRREYRRAIAGSPQEEIVERWFGSHNLSSDKEPEEMLTVEKSHLQAYYKNVVEAIGAEDGDTKIEMKGRRIALEYIFGKDTCLPDPSEEKPTPKFKVGDKVMVTATNTSRTDCVAEIMRINENIQNNFPYYVRGETGFGGYWTGCFKESDLIPYTALKFKVGDKVKVLREDYKDEITEIIYVDESDDITPYKLDLLDDEGGGVWMEEENLEPYTTPTPQPEPKDCYEQYCDAQAEEQNQIKDDMEEKELNLLTLLKGCEGEKFYSSAFGEVTIEGICSEEMEVVIKDIATDFDYGLNRYGCLISTPHGQCILFPSRDLYLKYPLEAAKAWKIWTEERKSKRWRAKQGDVFYRIEIDGQIFPRTESFTFGDNKLFEQYNYFRTESEAKEAAEAVKHTLEEFHEKNAEK